MGGATAETRSARPSRTPTGARTSSTSACGPARARPSSTAPPPPGSNTSSCSDRRPPSTEATTMRDYPHDPDLDFLRHQYERDRRGVDLILAKVRERGAGDARRVTNLLQTASWGVGHGWALGEPVDDLRDLLRPAIHGLHEALEAGIQPDNFALGLMLPVPLIAGRPARAGGGRPPVVTADRRPGGRGVPVVGAPGRRRGGRPRRPGLVVDPGRPGRPRPPRRRPGRPSGRPPVVRHRHPPRLNALSAGVPARHDPRSATT